MGVGKGGLGGGGRGGLGEGGGDGLGWAVAVLHGGSGGLVGGAYATSRGSCWA